MNTALDACRYCGSADLFTVVCEPTVPHYARTGCRHCGRFLQWEPAPMNPGRARAFIMPFGKYRGLTLGEIGLTDEGARYLRWMLEQRDPGDSISRAILCYLDSKEETP